ncbi:glycosyl hydrolase [Actinoplanes sp. NBRC 101535]|uniref:glycosyl hydrolase n=1 Tax=Actinoplanes sp. NBRC 101535 TaxID=3032196 RepID=UPI0024A2CA6E|nr:glycosyl hydrolase [Actinoplanes sp. NBRC 101535]GLY06767.1 hydrolase [Actinoplanes sp. NBRC 101535]
MHRIRRPLVCLTAVALLLTGACKTQSSAASTPVAIVASTSASTAPSASSASPSPVRSLSSTAATATASPSPSASRSAAVAATTADKAPAAAPYLDVVSGTADIAAISKKTGLTDFTLAFVLAATDGSCTATWGGEKKITDSGVQEITDAIGDVGGEAVVATGGASGTYLESVCSASELATAYGDALDAADSNTLDVDIEQSVDVDTVTSALAILQKKRDTAISLTVPVEGTSAGLSDAATTLLRSAEKAGVEVTVNAMTMNFGYDGNWGDAMNAATEAVHADMAAIWTGRSDAQLYRMLGITPMIGVNDTGPVTTVAHAKTVLSFAEEKNLAFVRFWSINRDNGDCADGSLSFDCSGIDQNDYAFTKLFADFDE